MHRLLFGHWPEWGQAHPYDTTRVIYMCRAIDPRIGDPTRICGAMRLRRRQ